MISESDFVNVWGARVAASGDLLSYQEVQGSDLQTVWSIVEADDDSWIALPGFHVVNVMGYALTERRWETGEEEAMWFEAFEQDDQGDNEP